MKNKKWHNVELKEKKRLKEFLQANKIEFEISKNGDFYHFEILLENEGVEFQKVNEFIG